MNSSRCLLVALLACVLLSFTPVRAQTPPIVPIDWSRFKGMQGFDPKDELGAGLVQILQNQSRYTLNWLKSELEVRDDLPEFKGIPCYYPKLAPEINWGESIRPQAQIVFATAVVIKTGLYSPEIIGMPEAEAVKRVEMAIRGAAFTHLANTNAEKKWGHMWQSAFWSSEFSDAAWMLWDRMSIETKTAVAKMTESEADNFIDYKVPYYGDETGKVIRPGDTAAEENAWNSRALMVAVAMMPNHPNKDKWLAKACELMVSAYALPKDMTDAAPIDGRPLKDWLHGYNALDIGLVVNHGRVHPDYAACIYMNCTAAVDCALANRTTPESAFHNLDVVYNAMATYKFVPGKSKWTKLAIAPPGGTIFRRGADGSYEPQMYYPNGADWTNYAYDNVMLDIDAFQRGVDAGKDYSCLGWAKARTAAIIKLQNRPGHDGNIYEDGDWKSPTLTADPGSFQALSEAWMLWWLMQHKMIPPVAPAF